MEIAALIAWILTAGGGFLLLGAPTAAAAPAPTAAAEPAERNLPVPVVLGHGIFAATTLVLVVLAAAGVGT